MWVLVLQHVWASACGMGAFQLNKRPGARVRCGEGEQERVLVGMVCVSTRVLAGQGPGGVHGERVLKGAFPRECVRRARPGRA